MLTRFLGVVFIISFYPAIAQKTLTRDSQYWFKYYNQLNFSKGVSWHNEVDTRHSLETNKQQQFIAHSRIHKNLNKNINVAAGFTYSSMAKKVSTESPLKHLHEFRPVQEINYSVPSKRFVLHNRIRLDERLLQSATQSEPEYFFLLRYRYRLQMNYIIKPKSAYEGKIKLGDEIMFQSGLKAKGKFFDQNRISIGYDQSLGKNLSVELGYTRFYQQKISNQEYLSRDILRLTINQKINRNEQN